MFHQPRGGVWGSISAGAVAALLLMILGLLSAMTAYADAAAQSRRQTHFEWLKARSVFQSMDIVNGVPQLVLGAGRAKTDQQSLSVFCKIILDYFVERDPAVKQLLIVDGFSGATIATVDSTGFHSI